MTTSIKQRLSLAERQGWPALSPHVTFGELLAVLDIEHERKATRIITNGFDMPHVYRGNRLDIAFEPRARVPLAEMREVAHSARHRTLPRLGGGSGQIMGWGLVWLAQWSDTGQPLTPYGLHYILDAAVS